MSIPDTAAELHSAVLSLVGQPSWRACRETVEAHPELVSPAADAVLDAVITAARQGNSPHPRRLLAGLEELRQVLRRAREIGVERAFAEADDAGEYGVAALLPPGFATQSMLMVFVGAGTWPESRQVLDLHPELLEPAVDTAIDRLAVAMEAAPGTEGAVAMLRSHQTVLRRCREIGVDATFAELMAPPAADAVRDGVMAFLLAPTPREARRRLDQQPEAIGARGLQVVDEVIRRARQEAPDGTVDTLLDRRGLLSRSAEIGVEAAFAEGAPDLAESELVNLMQEVLRSGGLHGAAALVRDHPELLRDDSGDVAAALRSAAKASGDTGVGDALDQLATIRRMRDGRDSSPDPSDAGVLPAVHAFLGADTWVDSRRVVEQHPELLGDAADRVLARLEREAKSEGHDDVAGMVRTHRTLLRRSGEVGVARAFAEIGQADDDPSASEVEAMLQEALTELTENGAPPEALLQQQARTALYLFERWEHSHAPADLDAAIRCSQEAARLAPEDDTYPYHLKFLGRLLRARHDRTNSVEDLTAAVHAYRSAAAHCPPTFPARSTLLTHLAHAIADLQVRTGDPALLDEAIRAYRDAASAAGPGDPDIAALLGNLSEGLRARFTRTADPIDLDAIVDALRRATQAATPHEQMWFDLHNNLGVALVERFGIAGGLHDLDEAIAVYDQTVPRLAGQPEELSIHLAGRGNAWRRRHQHDRTAASIDRAIDDYRAAARVARDTDMLASHVTSAANSLIDRFELLGGLPDLDEAINAYRRAITLRPGHHKDRTGLLTALANALAQRWTVEDELLDLDDALRIQQEAVDATPSGSDDRPGHLSNLGNRYLDRYLAAGDPSDIDEAIRHHAEAVRVTPARSDELPAHLGNWATSLRQRYNRVGDPADLDSAVEASRRAVTTSAPDSDPGHLSNWAISLLDRYHLRCTLDDLRTADDALRRATAAPDDRWSATAHGALAAALRARYDNTRVSADLDEVVRIHEHVLRQRLPGHERLRHLSGLANALSDRYDRDHNEDDLQLAIRYQREVFEHIPPQSPDRARHCANLSGKLIKLADRPDHTDALAEALTYCHEAVDLSADTAPDLPGHLSNLGEALRRTGDDRSATEAYRRACELGVARAPRSVIVAAGLWGRWAAHRRSWAEAREAYAYGLDGLHRLVGSQASRTDKETWIRGTRRLATGLAIACAAVGDHRAAVGALERGRAMLLTEMLDETAALRPTGLHVRERSTASDEPPAVDADATAPMVYWAADDASGHAFVARDTDVAHVRLPDLTEPTLRSRTADHMRVYEMYRQDPNRYATQWSASLAEITGWLWPTVVGPVLDTLTAATDVVFIPGGLLGLLPLHAAWTPDSTTATGRRYALDELTISYAPNARALRTARQLAARTSPRHRLAVVEPQTTAGALPSARAENLGFAAGTPDLPTTALHGPDATPLRFRDHAADADVLHLICHGIAGLTTPLDSALLLAPDRRVRLRDLMKMPLQVRLAVLSACETGMPGVDLPDEVVALPTGLLQAGVAGVVASQWIVPDAPTAMLMTEFAHRWAGGTMPPAAALRHAQQWLRDTTADEKIDHWTASDLPAMVQETFLQATAFGAPTARNLEDMTTWAAFMHVGA